MMKQKVLPSSPDHDHSLLRQYQRILVQAARDLAALTNKGFYAHEIVDLAHKCEEYSRLLGKDKESQQHRKRLLMIRADLSRKIARLCHLADEIWPAPHEKSRLYQLSNWYTRSAGQNIA